MPNNTGEFATRVAALRQKLDAAQVRLADVARQQNALLEKLARDELEQQKERIGTYQIQARFALAAIYDRAAAPPTAAPSAAPHESQGDTEQLPSAEGANGAAPGDESQAPLDNAPPPRVDEPQPAAPSTDVAPTTDSAPAPAPTDSAEPAVNTSAPPTEAPK
jgi:hypothetical protein